MFEICYIFVRIVSETLKYLKVTIQKLCFEYVLVILLLTTYFENTLRSV